MNASKKKSNLPKIIIGVVGVAAITCGVLFVVNNSKNETTSSAPVAETIAEPDPQITEMSAKYLFVGTTFWGRDTNKNARASDLGVSYPFSKLDTFGRENYQAWVGGLECPLTDKGHNYAEENNLFKFNCDPDYLPEAAKYFTAFLLGNNHAGNQGLEGMRSTRKYLDEYGIQYFGTPKRTASDKSDTEYRNDEEDISNCDVVVLTVKAKYDNGEIKDQKFPFGFCSAHGVYGVPGDDFQQNIKTYSGVIPTIAMPHMGTEYQTSHDTLRQNLYRRYIDYGAESVIADHPHTIQDTEAYNGKLIVYSMGNFMFDQARNKEVARSAAIEANVTITGASENDLTKWSELADKCLEDKKTCFENIKAAGLKKPTTAWVYNYHGSVSAPDRIPRAATEAENAEIGQRLNWSATVSGLK